MSKKTQPEIQLIEVTPENISDHPQSICFINPKHEFYEKKIEWYINQYKVGLRIKLLYIEGEKKPVGFIEYVPGENCWRAVDAKGYMFIHCLWINGNKYKGLGLGTKLLVSVEQEAKKMLGSVALVSDKAFMASKGLFIKNNYEVVAESGTEQLLVKTFKSAPPPTIRDWHSELKKYQGLVFLYSKQCPWVARFIGEVKPFLEDLKLSPKVIELETPQEAQRAPSLYSGFNLIYNGKLLADRYISTTRFINIVKKEIL